MLHTTKKTKQQQLSELEEQFQQIISKGFTATLEEQQQAIQLGQQIEQLKEEIEKEQE